MPDSIYINPHNSSIILKMVGNALIAYLGTVGIDFLAFTIMFGVFAFYRRIRSKRVTAPAHV